MGGTSAPRPCPQPSSLHLAAAISHGVLLTSPRAGHGASASHWVGLRGKGSVQIQVPPRLGASWEFARSRIETSCAPARSSGPGLCLQAWGRGGGVTACHLPAVVGALPQFRDGEPKAQKHPDPPGSELTAARADHSGPSLSLWPISQAGEQGWCPALRHPSRGRGLRVPGVGDHEADGETLAQGQVNILRRIWRTAAAGSERLAWF